MMSKRILPVILFVTIGVLVIWLFCGLSGLGGYIKLMKYYHKVKLTTDYPQELNLFDENIINEQESIFMYSGAWGWGNILVWGKSGPKYFKIDKDTEYYLSDICNASRHKGNVQSFRELMKNTKPGSQVLINYENSLSKIKTAKVIFSAGNSYVFGPYKDHVYCGI